MELSKVKHLHLLRRNRRWWSAPLKKRVKLSYYVHILSAFSRSLSKNTHIKYLGSRLYYDNFITPLSLQAYPSEISNSILSNLSETKLKNVLDIGGNIGQFSLTLSHFLEDAVNIDVFEPNSEIFELLKKNTHHKRNIRTFNFGLGKPSTGHMYYTPGKSATGSFFKSNVSNNSKAKKLKIEVADDVSKATGRKKYDLVKIDVEGYEYRLLEAVKPFTTKFMFLEVSLDRYKDFCHSKLFTLIEEKFGKFDIVHLSHGNKSSNNFDVMLKFI